MQAHTLTESQWQVIKNIYQEVIVNAKHDLRAIFDVMFYVLKTGCHWRMLSTNCPKWELVYYYFSRWRDEDLFVHLNDMTIEIIRLKCNKNAQCSVAIIDSQSIKTTCRGWVTRNRWE